MGIPGSWSREVTFSCWLELLSSEGSTGLENPLASSLMCLLEGTIPGPEVSVSCCMGLSKPYSQHPWQLAACFPQNEGRVGAWGNKKEVMSFYNLISEVTCHQLCRLLLVIPTNPVQCRRGAVGGNEYQEVVISGNHLGSCPP